MTQPIHTPGPVEPYNPAEGCKNDGHYWKLLESRKDAIGAKRIVASDMCRDDARLLAAAYNAFDSAARVLGVNAVELAERMQAGEIAQLIGALVYGLGLVRNEYPAFAAKASAILAKVKAGVA